MTERQFNIGVILLLLLGAALRFAWAIHDHQFHPIASEMYEIAHTYARTGVIGDVYRPGSGPTAHETPGMPIFIGEIYRLFGADSPRSEWALSFISLGFIGATAWLFNRAFRLLGTPAAARLAAIALLCILPLSFDLEMVVLRVWEQGIAAALMALYLWLVLREDAEARPVPWLALVLFAAFSGLIALICPAAALATYGCLGLLALRKRGIVAFGVATALSVVILVGLSYPWALRNEAVFGEKIWSRSNFGFNFAMGFNDAAVHPSDPKRVWVETMAATDPYRREPGYRAMIAAGGELGYDHMMTHRTLAWIKAHPAATVTIGLRHLREFYFPPKWHWEVYTEKVRAVLPKLAITWATTLAGFVAIGYGLWRRIWGYLYVLAMITLPAVPYLLVQPVLRYRYVISTLLLFLTADLLVRLWRDLSARSVQAAPGRPPSGHDPQALPF